MPRVSEMLAATLSRLPQKPGIYRMLNEQGVVLYVGKAANLKKRVGSYFSGQTKGAKTHALVEQITAVEVTVTRTETEALLLESQLIKALHPKYNVLLRDDKSYPYIHVQLSHAFPSMRFYRSKKKPASIEYFGPYPSISAMKETLNTIQKIFQIRNCSDGFFASRSRPCLQYQIKRCTAPCTAYISQEDYHHAVQDAIRFLKGQSQQVIQDLEARLNEAVQQWHYEQAAVLRDQIQSLRVIQEQQSMTHYTGEADVIAMGIEDGFACVQWVAIRQGDVADSQRFFPKLPAFLEEENPELPNLRQQVFEAFVAFHYLEDPKKIPECIILEEDIPQLTLIETTLKELSAHACRIQIHPRGMKQRWLDFARNNLRLAMQEYTASTQMMQARYQALETFLKLKTPIERMECFDISHTSGEATVASCVVFDKNGPSKKDYRRFNIRNITPGDDYAAMAQALRRRFSNPDIATRLPDVLIIDGGKGQIHIAKNILQEFNIMSIYLLGIAKGPGRKAGLERLIIASVNQEYTLSPDSPVLHLLQYIRDEAHRFAITAHRKKRQKARVESSLEAIEGIGPKRRQALLRRFGGWQALAKAPLDEIAKVPGIHFALAERIFQYLHPEDTL